MEDPPFLGVSSFVLQFVSLSYHTRAFSPLATPPLIRIDSDADSWAGHACPRVRACTHTHTHFVGQWTKWVLSDPQGLGAASLFPTP